MSTKPRKKLQTVLAPIDPDVKIPLQVREAAARSERYFGPVAQPQPTTVVKTVNSIPTFAEVKELLKRWAPQGTPTAYPADGLIVSDRDFAIIISALQDYARLKEGFSKGANLPRTPSQEVTRRLEATIDVYRSLSPKLQKYRNGKQTIESLRAGVIKKLGLTDDDNVISEDVVRKDVSALGTIFSLIEKGIIPPSGKPIKSQVLSKQTLLERAAGKNALKAIANGTKTEPLCEIPHQSNHPIFFWEIS